MSSGFNDWRDRGRKKKMLLPEVHDLWHNHSLAVLMRNKVQGAEGTCFTGAARPESFWHCWGQCAPAPGSPPVPAHGIFHQTVCFPVVQLTCEQLFFQSIMSTVEALCMAKKRSACQNCGAKVPCSVSVSFFWVNSQLCVNVVTYSIVNESWLCTGTQSDLLYLLPPILVHWLLLARRNGSTLMNYLQDCNLSSRQLHFCKLCSYILNFPAASAQINYLNILSSLTFTLLIQTNLFFNQDLFYYIYSTGYMHWHNLQGHLPITTGGQ